MWFWWFIFICDCLVPIMMIVFGRYMWKHYPKQINGFIGYRTKMSMKNMDTWIFAHEYAGKFWWKIGWLMLVPTVVVHIPIYGASDNTIGVVSGIVIMIQLILLIWSIYPTEKALKKTFNEDGTKLY